MTKRLAVAFLVAALGFSFVSVASAQDEKPYLLFGQAGFAKMLEDGAPGGSIGFGAGILYMLPSKPSVAIGGEVSYLMLGSQDFELLGESWEAKSSVIPITAQLAYFIETQSKASPFVTVGAGLYNYRTKVDDETESDSNMGINVGGGVKMDTEKRMSFGAEARLHIVFTEDDSTNLLTVMGKLFF